MASGREKLKKKTLRIIFRIEEKISILKTKKEILELSITRAKTAIEREIHHILQLDRYILKLQKIKISASLKLMKMFEKKLPAKIFIIFCRCYIEMQTWREISKSTKISQRRVYQYHEQGLKILQVQ